MSKFKVGDRVRVGVEEPDLMCRPEESSGMVGVITCFSGEGQYADAAAIGATTNRNWS